MTNSSSRSRLAATVSPLAIGLAMLVARAMGFQTLFGLLTGVVQMAVIHYFIAKILGPLLFGRLWCGFACPQTVFLDTWMAGGIGRAQVMQALARPVAEQ